MSNQWMTPQQVEEETDISVETLRKNRALGRGFPYYKPNGGRTVLYKRDEISELIEASRVETRRTA